MKIKLLLSSLLILASTGCVTSTHSYTRDIVYRDGSYYSPADEEYGDYYYAPESDYAYYDDDYYSDPYYGFGSSYYSSPWYSHYSSRCRFSYRHDRYCNTGWGRSYLHFGGLTLIFGGFDYYAYGSPYYRYPYYGHDYGHGHHGYPYHYWQQPRPRDPRQAIPMPKPRRPDNQVPDYSMNPSPGMRVPGEPIRTPTKPRRIDNQPVEPITVQQPGVPLRMNTKPARLDRDAQPVIEGNPYVRRPAPRPELRPENDYAEQQARPRTRTFIREDSGEVIRSKPGRVIISEDQGEQNAYRPMPKPGRQDREPQPYLRERPSAPAVVNYNEAPVRQIREERQERPAPRIERVERVERVERAERPVREIRVQQEEKDGAVN